MQYSAGHDRTVKYPRTVKYKKGRTGKLFQDSKVQDRIGQVSEVLLVSDLLPVSKVQDRTCRQSAFGQLSTGKAFEVLHESELQDRTGQAKTGLDRLVIRLLHPQHLDGIWIGQNKSRLPLAPLNEFPEPWR